MPAQYAEPVADVNFTLTPGTERRRFLLVGLALTKLDRLGLWTFEDAIGVCIKILKKLKRELLQLS